MKQIITLTLIVPLSLMTLTACGLTSPPRQETTNPSIRQPIESTRSPEKTSPQTIEQLLAQQDYAEAIRLAAKEARQPSGQGPEERFIKAVNAGLNQADLLMQSENYGPAAQLLKTIRDCYPSKASLQQQLAKTSSQVTEALDLCTQSMMAAGLMAYRAGDLPGAVDIWEKIIAVDPQHAAAHNSLQTARMQLSRLKSLNEKN